MRTSQCQEFLPVASSFLQNESANKLVQLIAGPWGVSMNTDLTFHRSGTRPAGRRSGRVPSLPFPAINPPRQPAIPDEGRSTKNNRLPTISGQNFYMTTQEIRTLPIDEKVRIMAAIWEDMRDHHEEAPISQDAIDLLKERRSRINRGEAQLLDWDKVKFAS